MTASGDLESPPYAVGQSFFSDRSWSEESVGCFSHFHGKVVQAFVMLGLCNCSMCEEGVQHGLLLEIEKVLLLSKCHGSLAFIFCLDVHELPLQTGIVMKKLA